PSSVDRGSLRRERLRPDREAFGSRMPGGVSSSKPPGLVRLADPGTATLPSGGPQSVREEPAARTSPVRPAQGLARLREQSRLPLRRPLPRLDVPSARLWEPKRLRGLYRVQPLRRRQVRRGGVQRGDRELSQGLSLPAGRSALQRYL